MSDPCDSSPSRRHGRGAILSFLVTGHQSATVVLAVEHRDTDDASWEGAACPSILTPGETTLQVYDLKRDLRYRFNVLCDGGGPVEVRGLPPEWLPY